MDIRIDPSGAPSLEHASDFASLRLIGPVPTPLARATLREWGIELTDDASHAFVDPNTIVQLAASNGEEARWKSDFASMITFAREHGWIDEGGRVQVHAEWTAP